jgi:hypothetical protein
VRRLKKLLDSVALWVLIFGGTAIIALMAAVAAALPDKDRSLAWTLAGLVTITGLAWRRLALTQQDEPLFGNPEAWSLIVIAALAGSLVFGLMGS